MAPKLKPLKDAKDISAVPLTEPVLIEIAPTPTGREEPEAGTDAAQIAAPEVVEQQDDKPDTGAAKLQKELETMKAADKLRTDEIARERKRADDATKLAQDRERELSAARNEREQAVTDNISSALSGAQSEQESAEQEYASAFQNQDPMAMAKAQGKIARAAAKVLNYEAAAAELDDRRKNAAAEAERRPTQQQQAPVDIVTAVNTNPGLLQTERDWLLKHQEVLVDRGRGVELEAAYIKATRNGHHRGTDAYFQFLDQELGYKEKPTPKVETEDNEEEASIMAAPVSRDSISPSNGQSQQSNRVVLSPAQRDLAQSMGIDEITYARNVLKLRDEKKANPEKYRG